jgi:hypothetical protein
MAVAASSVRAITFRQQLRFYHHPASLWRALRGSTKLILLAAGGVGSVLDLDPVRRSTGAIWAIAVLGNQALQSQF